MNAVDFNALSERSGGFRREHVRRFAPRGGRMGGLVGMKLKRFETQRRCNVEVTYHQGYLTRDISIFNRLPEMDLVWV